MSLFHRKKLRLKKKNCDIKMKLVPCGSGWTDVYLDICGDSHYFIISNVMGGQFEDLLRILYHMHPSHGDPENVDHIFDHKLGIVDTQSPQRKVVKIVDDDYEMEPGKVCVDIPWRAQFLWSEEKAESRWTLERTPDESTDFMLKIHIEHERNETKVYDYEVPYKEFCYAVAKACTGMLKEYGFYGYHHSAYTQDLNVRYLLFLKSVALNNFEARKLAYYNEKDHGETTNLETELELLLFDM